MNLVPCFEAGYCPLGQLSLRLGFSLAALPLDVRKGCAFP